MTKWGLALALTGSLFLLSYVPLPGASPVTPGEALTPADRVSLAEPDSPVPATSARALTAQRGAGNGVWLMRHPGDELPAYLPLAAFERSKDTARSVLAWDPCMEFARKRPPVRFAAASPQEVGDRVWVKGWSQIHAVRTQGMLVRAGRSKCYGSYDYGLDEWQLTVIAPANGTVPFRQLMYLEVVGSERTRPPKPPPATPEPPPPAAPLPPALGPPVCGEDDPRPKVAYMITVTKDGPYMDGAAVMGHSALRQHCGPGPGARSPFAADLVAIVRPGLVDTLRQLERLTALGQRWTVAERKLPIDLDRVPEAYRKEVVDSGCCGADELLKLHAWTFTQYKRVVHLDMDSAVLGSLDEVLLSPEPFIYTFDWGMKGGNRKAPVQGGFLLLTPSRQTYDELRAVAQRGNWHPGTGWEGSRIGNFWGGSTIQGLLSYYFNVARPGHSRDLDVCVYNAMADRPWRDDKVGPESGCLDGTTTCRDCRNESAKQVRLVHFTICQKPWVCYEGGPSWRPWRLCVQLQQRWFDLRLDMEQTVLGYDRSRYPPACSPMLRQRHSFCGCGGEKHYRPLPLGIGS